MKTFAVGALTILLAFVGNVCAGDETIDAAAAAQAIGKTIVLSDVVTEVVVNESGAVFLNFGGAYPNEVFRVVVLSKLKTRFPEAENLENKRVRITGEVVEYEGYPRIILRNPEQLTVVVGDDE